MQDFCKDCKYYECVGNYIYYNKIDKSHPNGKHVGSKKYECKYDESNGKKYVYHNFNTGRKILSCNVKILKKPDIEVIKQKYEKGITVVGNMNIEINQTCNEKFVFSNRIKNKIQNEQCNLLRKEQVDDSTLGTKHDIMFCLDVHNCIKKFKYYKEWYCPLLVYHVPTVKKDK